MSQVVISRAEADDAAGLAEVHNRAWQTAYRGQMPDAFLDALDLDRRTAMWRTFLETQPPTGTDTSVFVARVEGRIAGWVLVGPTRDNPFEAADQSRNEDNVGEVFAINLDPDFFRQGIGTLLMERGVGQLRDLGFRRITLWVLDGNSRARSFYDQLGWVHDGAKKTGNFGGAELVELRYQLTLN